MNRWVTLGLVLAALGAVVLRWPAPGQRPMHNDEAVNGVKFGQLWERGAYRYDPNEHHGPTLYYFTAGVSALSGAPGVISGITDERLRWVTVLFGVGLVWLVLLFRDGLGQAGLLWAGILIAVSPAFVFYSQYYIHEMLLVFFAAGVLGCGWRYWISRKVGWALLCGICLGLMAATKETFVLSAAAGLMALVANQAWSRLLDAAERPATVAPLSLRHLGLGAAACLAAAGLMFSSFFANPTGILDAVRTYQPWLARAGGDSPHLHPWYFYIERLLFFKAARGAFWTEGFILLLAAIGAYAGFSRKGLGGARAGLLRFLAFYSVVLAGIYAAIWYKTPWCLLNFWHGFLLLAGAGAGWMLHAVPGGWKKGVVVAVLLGGTAHLGFESYRAVNVSGADRSNPYVYAQTSANLLRLVERVDELAGHASGADTLIKVMAGDGDYWPLPWYFRQYKNVGWWERLAADPYAPLMVVSAEMKAALDEKGTHLMVGYSELRPGVFLELYVEFELWKRYLEKRTTADAANAPQRVGHVGADTSLPANTIPL